MEGHCETFDHENAGFAYSVGRVFNPFTEDKNDPILLDPEPFE
jgi:hypothetical protein